MLNKIATAVNKSALYSEQLAITSQESLDLARDEADNAKDRDLNTNSPLPQPETYNEALNQ